MSGGGKGGNSGPSESKIKDAMIYPELRDPAFTAIQQAKRLYEQGYQVPGMNRRQQEGVESTEDWASKFGSMIDEPLEYAGYLSQGKGVGDAPGQEFLQGIYQQGAPTAGYGSQEQVLRNLMRNNGAGYGTQENILGQAMGKTGNLDYLQNTAEGGMLNGNPRLDAVISDMNRGTTQAYQDAMGSLEGGMSRAGQMGGSVESQLKARENEGLARSLAANEEKVRYGDYANERGFQQQAGLALPGAFQTDIATKSGAAGQLNDMEARRVGLQQGAAGQLNDMSYRKLQAEMEAAGGAGAGYRADVGQALGAGQMMPGLGAAGFGVGQQLMGAGDYTQAQNERQANSGWETLSRYIDANRGVAGMMSGSPGAAQQQQPAGQGLFNNAMGVAGLGLKAYGMGMFSDRRLKTNVELVGFRNGLPIYAWNYAWGGRRYEGPMAQDVLAVAPELVTEVAGYLAIPASMVREVG